MKTTNKPGYVRCPECGDAEVEIDCKLCGGTGMAWSDSYGYYHSSPHDYEIEDGIGIERPKSPPVAGPGPDHAVGVTGAGIAPEMTEVRQ